MGPLASGAAPGRFMASRTDGDARIVLLGAPLDVTTSFRPGTRFGPARIRDVSDGLEEFSPVLGRELGDVPFVDAGDLDLPIGNVEQSLALIERAVAGIARDKRFPLILGGEHLLTLGAVKALYDVYPDLVVVQIDAHADLRDDYLEQRLSHATVVRRIAELIGPKRVYQLGIRSGTREEFDYGRSSTRFYPLAQGGSLPPLAEQIVDPIGDRPVYITLDIDVVDPAYAPGTGTPEPGGIDPLQLLTGLYALQPLNVVGMDIVEVCPPQDSSDITALLAAKLVREAVLSFGYTFQIGRRP